MTDRRTFLTNTAAMASQGALLALGAATSRAVAQGSKAATMLVGFPAGGGPDIVARTLVEYLRTQADETFIVENKTGAGGRIALEALKNGRADGSLFALTPSGTLTLLQHVYKRLPYDAPNDFIPICRVCNYYSVIVASAQAPYKTLGEFIAWAKSNPGKATYGVPGTGNSPDFIGYLLAQGAQIQMTPIAYRGGPQLTQAILSNEVSIGINVPSNFSELVNAGKIRTLAITSDKRSPLDPDAPTLAELGIPRAGVAESFGIVAKAGTPQHVISRLEQAVSNVLALPQAREALQRLQYLPDFLAGGPYGKELARSTEQWKKIVSDAGFKQLDQSTQ